MAKPKAKARAKTSARPKAKLRAKAAKPELRHITLSSLHRPPGSHRARIRKGRGPGSGIGKTAGRGGKGQTARQGGKVRPGFEGGQMPLIRRIPKRGFTNPFKQPAQVVNVRHLILLAEGVEVTPETLFGAGLVRRPDHPINLFKVPELKEKLLFTFLCLVIYRIGAHIATPGVNVDALADFMSTRGTGTLFGLYDLFSGGGLRRATVFALGIMPYISASIVFQLAGPVFPIIEKMQRDEEGKKTLTQWTRYLTVVLCFFQAYGFGVFTESLPNAVAQPGFAFRMTTVLTLTTGGIFVMWLGEQITERGIGNGMSLLIFFSIIERILPETVNTFEALKTGTLSFPVLLIVLIMCVLVVAGTVAITVAARRIPVQIPRKVMGRGRIREGQKTL